MQYTKSFYEVGNMSKGNMNLCFVLIFCAFMKKDKEEMCFILFRQFISYLNDAGISHQYEDLTLEPLLQTRRQTDGRPADGSQSRNVTITMKPWEDLKKHLPFPDFSFSFGTLEKKRAKQTGHVLKKETI